ncbi:hypothetical protein [Streptomyces microflavus]|uniref:hypothetical protein n=1 Tax=Streptomyces microflavus TaxID=1919 RepID=UPI003F4BFB62
MVQFTRTADKADSARALGVDDVVVSTDERAMARQKGRFDLLLDTVGARRAVYDRPRHGRHALPDRHGGGATALKARAGPPGAGCWTRRRRSSLPPQVRRPPLRLPPRPPRTGSRPAPHRARPLGAARLRATRRDFLRAVNGPA